MNLHWAIWTAADALRRPQWDSLAGTRTAVQRSLGQHGAEEHWLTREVKYGGRTFSFNVHYVLDLLRLPIHGIGPLWTAEAIADRCRAEILASNESWTRWLLRD